MAESQIRNPEPENLNPHPKLAKTSTTVFV